MFKLKLKIQQIICLVAALLLVGCSDEERETAKAVSVYRIVKEDTGNYSYLAAAIDRAGLKDLLDSDESNVTLLAPTNQAFIDAGFANVNTIRITDPALLAKVLQYHIIENKFETSTIVGPQSITSLDDNELFFDKRTMTGSVEGKPVTLIDFYVNGADILSKDIFATNGNVQLINKLLVPKTTKNIMQAMTARADYSLFVAAVNRASLGSVNYAAQLSSTTNYTVFAPTNAAITEFLLGKYSTEAKIATIDPNIIASELVGNHIILNAYFSYNLLFSPLSLNQGKITVSSVKYYNAANSVAGTNTVLNGSLLIRNNANEMVSNGFVNGTTTVFALPTSLTLFETIQANLNLTYLMAAIERASASGIDLKGMLSSSGEQTLYAPTNQAFRNEGYESVDIIYATSPEILAELLTKHVFAGYIYSNSYPVGKYTVESISGVPVEFDTSSDLGVFGAKGPLNLLYGAVTTKDEIRTNGVFNIINQVIK
ncbi:fasciclin domain-containing protein [Flavobacterium algicola]|uniref:fasciclin domain-containing protein n=1 Tax=Flavobacterium algicola TaxID=556529 RepID=UPI001EFD93DA|nr:fasciclin domain-containing protein [Flavobacterium algicola]MCG9793081.1 fasciclin domain-containing protein [Flavobacterium algicola]